MKYLTLIVTMILATFSSASTQTVTDIDGRIQMRLGDQNVAIGDLAGQFLTSGVANTFVGTFTGANDSSGTDNSFFGAAAGSNNLKWSSQHLHRQRCRGNNYHWWL